MWERLPLYNSITNQYVLSNTNKVTVIINTRPTTDEELGVENQVKGKRWVLIWTDRLLVLFVCKDLLHLVYMLDYVVRKRLTDDARGIDTTSTVLMCYLSLLGKRVLRIPDHLLSLSWSRVSFYPYPVRLSVDSVGSPLNLLVDYWHGLPSPSSPSRPSFVPSTSCPTFSPRKSCKKSPIKHLYCQRSCDSPFYNFLHYPFVLHTSTYVSVASWPPTDCVSDWVGLPDRVKGRPYDPGSTRRVRPPVREFPSCSHWWIPKKDG